MEVPEVMDMPKMLMILGISIVVGYYAIHWQTSWRYFYKKGNTTFYFPIVTSIVLSIVLSLFFIYR